MEVKFENFGTAFSTSNSADIIADTNTSGNDLSVVANTKQINAELYADAFRKEFEFNTFASLANSNDINDINTKIVDMMIRRGFFQVSSNLTHLSLSYEFAVSHHPEITNAKFEEFEFPKFEINEHNFAILKEYGNFQPIWDFAYSREYCVRGNPVAFGTPIPFQGYTARNTDMDDNYSYLIDVDHQSYIVDRYAGYYKIENINCEKIAYNLASDGVSLPFYYDGDFRKLLEYNIDFAYGINREEAIDTIMAEAESAARTLAYRRPSSNPYNIRSFQWMLINTQDGNFMQMPVLPEIKEEEYVH